MRWLLEQTESIPPENMELIFGRDFKLEAADPYLFYAYELRKYSLETRLIVSVGYGFGDGHINKILSQALERDGARRLLVICGSANENALQGSRDQIAGILGVKPDQVLVEKGSAKEFLDGSDLHDRLLKLIPKPESAPF